MAGKRRTVLTTRILIDAGVRYDRRMRRLIYAAVTIASWLLPHPSFAQGPDIGISGVGLLAIQPIDDAYVGSPYLSEGIGGLAPGFGAGFNVITPGGFVIATEYTTAFYEQEQNGRLVLGPFPLEQVPATTRLRDSLLHVVAGYATKGATRIVFLGGASFKLDRATIDDVEAEEYETDPASPFAFTGGIDVLHRLGERTDLLFTGRYTFNQRDTRLRYLGIGAHIIRAGVGLRIRIN
jgi:hypothetical protein